MPDAEVVKPKSEDEVQQESAAQNLVHIAALRRSLAFDYFLAEPKRKIEDLELRLRKRDLSEHDRQYILGQIHTFEHWLTKLDEDETSFRNISGLRGPVTPEGLAKSARSA